VNLILNAIQSLEGDGLRRYPRGSRELVLHPRLDNGCGIASEHTQIFDPFFTTKGRQARGWDFR
jgi:C4-dicarboxylate-specific signal transduction histidine kinase